MLCSKGEQLSNNTTEDRSKKALAGKAKSLDEAGKPGMSNTRRQMIAATTRSELDKMMMRERIAKMHQKKKGKKKK